MILNVPLPNSWGHDVLRYKGLAYGRFDFSIASRTHGTPLRSDSFWRRPERSFVKTRVECQLQLQLTLLLWLPSAQLETSKCTQGTTAVLRRCPSTSLIASSAVRNCVRASHSLTDQIVYMSHAKLRPFSRLIYQYLFGGVVRDSWPRKNLHKPSGTPLMTDWL